MKRKPSWGFWWTWVVVYTVLDMLFEAATHGGAAWRQVRGALEGAFFGATVTWFFALWRWYKAEDRF